MSVCSIVSESSNRRDVCICLGCKPNSPFPWRICFPSTTRTLHRGGITIFPAHAPRMENISLYASSSPLELHVDLFNSKGNSSILTLCCFSKELQEQEVGGGAGERPGAWGGDDQVLCREGERSSLICSSFPSLSSPSENRS